MYFLSVWVKRLSEGTLHEHVRIRKLQSVAKLVTHSAKFWNFLDERRTTAKKNTVCQM